MTSARALLAKLAAHPVLIAAVAFALVPVVLTFLAGRAQAADALPSFDALDKDKDGLITASEARANPSVAARFAEADKNQDGYLSRAEFNSIARP